jgi:hypothetical protein
MNFWVFQASDRNIGDTTKTGREYFNALVKERSVWGIGPRTAYRLQLQPGDRALFYLAGSKNQMFIGSVGLRSAAHADTSPEAKVLFEDPGMLRIDLDDVQIFAEPKVRQSFQSLEWRPTMGGISRISERDYNLVMGTVADSLLPISAPTGAQTEFVLEKYLEEFIISNWDKIDFGEDLELYKDEEGSSGQYFAEDAGYIDILAKDPSGNFVVIELKKGRKNDEVVGQVLRYMAWVRKNLAKSGEGVRGIIVVGERDAKLELSRSEVADKVAIKIYQVSFKLESY